MLLRFDLSTPCDEVVASGSVPLRTRSATEHQGDGRLLAAAIREAWQEHHCLDVEGRPIYVTRWQFQAALQMYVLSNSKRAGNKSIAAAEEQKELQSRAPEASMQFFLAKKSG